MNKAETSSLQISGLIATGQLFVVCHAPWVGYFSETQSRKPLLLLGFGIGAVRLVLFAVTTTYSWLLVGQLLGGLTSAIVEVLIIVIIAEVTAGTGRFNLVCGTVTMIMGIASSMSVAASGFIFRTVGHLPTFMIFAGVAGMATVLAWFLLPETK